VNGISEEEYTALRDSLDRPLFNRSLRGQYPPGSTIKPFIGLAGLEYNTRLSHSHTYCKGWFQLPGKEHKYRDWKKTGHGKTNLNWALQRSCDVYFYELALELGIDKIHDFLARFGFGQRSGLDIGGESSGLLPSREWKRNKRNKPWYPGETLITGIGQGFNLTTPLQLAVATAALGTRGNLIEPTVVSSLSVANSIVPMEPPRRNEIKLLENNWDEVIKGMIDVVNAPRGTAKKISHDIQYVMAGKTGTAQVFGIGQEDKYKAKDLVKRLHDHALFIAFAPAENPTIALAVVVENGGGGSSTAAPIARKVIDKWLLKGLQPENVEMK
jgi:penicillin-binding protein 2